MGIINRKKNKVVAPEPTPVPQTWRDDKLVEIPEPTPEPKPLESKEQALIIGKEVVDGKTVTTLPNPGAKTKMEVSNYLKENGIAQGSEDYNRMYEEFSKELPIQ